MKDYFKMGYLLKLLTVSWSIYEPISAMVFLYIHWKDQEKQRTSYKEFNNEAGYAFELAATHIERFGLKRENFAPRTKVSYLDELKQIIPFKRKNFQYAKGELELFFLSKFILPKKNRVNQFLITSFFYVEGYEKYFRFLRRREWLISKLSPKSKTLYHYLSIPNWVSKRINSLVSEVEKIKKVDPDWNLKYKLPRAEEILKNKPAISHALGMALEKGKIAERTVFNLSASEKLIFVHKYGEGFGEVYSEYSNVVEEARIEVEKAKKSRAKDANIKLEKAKLRYNELRDNWPRVPLNTVLEREGFQKLFRNLEGVYVLPLSLIPEKYQENVEEYFEEVIIESAHEYLQELKESHELVELLINDLKYLLLYQVIKIKDIGVISKDRSLEVSSKALSKMLMSTFLSKDNSQLSTVYVNDLIRNIEFSTLVKENKTGQYILHHIDLLKRILFEDYKIQLYKPIGLITLNQGQIDEIIDKLLQNDSSAKRYLLKRSLIEIVDFYKQLNSDLEDIINKKK